MIHPPDKRGISRCWLHNKIIVHVIKQGCSVQLLLFLINKPTKTWNQVADCVLWNVTSPQLKSCVKLVDLQRLKNAVVHVDLMHPKYVHGVACLLSMHEKNWDGSVCSMMWWWQMIQDPVQLNHHQHNVCVSVLYPAYAHNITPLPPWHGFNSVDRLFSFLFLFGSLQQLSREQVFLNVAVWGWCCNMICHDVICHTCLIDGWSLKNTQSCGFKPICEQNLRKTHLLWV